MRLSEIRFPNIRKLIIPDPGNIICDVDLAGADAQVVAWEAADEDLKDAFRAGLKVHVKNALDIFGPEKAGEDGRREPLYTQCKSAVHGTNYGASARTLAITLGWSIRNAETFQDMWFSLHPGIKTWHETVDYALQTQRKATNQFGRTIYYFDRVDSLLPTALAWIPQSTVAIVCNKGLVALRGKLPFIKVRLQVHDSIVFEVPKKFFQPVYMKQVERTLRNPVPYEDPLVIPWELSASSENWGECKKVSWETLQ